MADLTRIGFALFLCGLTFLATKYGLPLAQFTQRKLLASLAIEKSASNTDLGNRTAADANDPAVIRPERAYDEVHALLLSWEGGDNRFYKELEGLARVFRDYYNYGEGGSTIEDFLIPSDNSKNVLDEKLSKFLCYDGPRKLLIIYYGGHGALNVARRAVWKKYEKDGPEVPWHDLQTKLFERQSDILLLIDCCAAAGAGVVSGAKGLVEVEFAGGFEAPTPVWGPHSFTRSLVNELEKVYDSGTTVYSLHHNLWNSLQHHRPQQNSREVRAKPHHEWLAPWPTLHHRSIHLQNLLSTTPIQLQQDALSPITLQRAGSFDIVKNQAKIKELHKWLEPIDQSKFHNNATAAQEKGTGEWLLQHPQFKRWIIGTDRCLIIYGTVGCGKTILCAGIANHMERLCRARDVSNHRDLTARFYFSFENFSQQHNLESLLKSMIQQLSFAPEIFSRLKELYEENTKAWPPSSPSVSSLQELLFAGLKLRCSNEKKSRKVFLVIDALDEIPKGIRRNQVVEFLKNLAALRIPFLHVLVTSRPKSDIRSPLSAAKDGWAVLNVDEAAISADIGIYVNAALDTDFVPPLSKDTKEKVRRRLTKDQHGMFRWASLQMESLKRLEPADSKSVEKALATLPPDLNSSYLKILKGINVDFQRQAQLVLIWLSLASRPLYIEEVVEISATDPRTKPGFHEARRFEQQEHVEQVLKDLIVIDPPLDRLRPSQRKNVVRIGHFSVKEYLTGADIKKSEAAMFSVSPDANKFVAQSCLAYLFHNNSNDKSEQAYCLREYAWNQWAWHSVYLNDSNRSEKAMDVFDSCVYEKDPSEGFARLRAFGLIDWVDPDSAQENSLLQSALRNPWSYRDFRLHFAFAPNTAFEYQPLQKSSDIRVLRILPSEYDSPEIRCQVVHTSLDDIPVPQYDAISYTWRHYGRERNSYIRLDGQPFRVRGKIASILRTLRSTNSSTSTHVWIDGLCINMPDEMERSSQVALMARIYRQAREVVVILEDEGVNVAAFDILRELSALLDNDDVSEPDLQHLRKVVAKYDSRTAWSIILSLFSQPWWRRLWPIQEVVLASKATIIYGNIRIAFDDIQKVMVKDAKANQLLQRAYTDREVNPTAAFSRRHPTWAAARALGELRITMQRDGRLELPHLLYASRFNGVSFSSDRIFSIYPLSLIGLDPEAIAPGMSVDYSLTPEEVFTNCSAYLLNQYRNLDQFSYIERRVNDISFYELPSWTSTFMSSQDNQILHQVDDALVGDSIYPTQRSRLSPRPLVKGKFQPLDGEDLYSACGIATVANISFHLWENLVIEKGIFVGRVSAFSDLHPNNEVHHSVLYADYILGRALDFYISKFDTIVPEVFWKTIVADQWELGSRSSPNCWPSWDLNAVHGMSSLPEYNIPSGLAFAQGRCIFQTDDDRLGLGPSNMREDDYIMVLPGGKVPFVFERVHENVARTSDKLQEGLKLRLIGECYVHGIMDGEIMKAAEVGEYEFQDVIIV